MTTTVPLVSQPNTAAQPANAAPSAASGTTSPVTGSQPAATRSYASATRNQISPPVIASSSTPVAVGGSGPVQHGKSNSISPVNGKPTPPAVPAVGGPPAIVNSSGPIVNGAPVQGDHNPSVSIRGGSTGGYVPNGASTDVNNRPNLKFGSVSPAITHPVPHRGHNSSLATPNSDPRISEPTTSPSPIPQPAASGGKPPSMQGQGTGLNFGSLGGDPGEHLRPVSTPHGPANAMAQGQHLRRESSQSSHSDMSAANMNMNRNFQPQAGRGNRFQQGFVPQTHSPGPQYRQPMIQQRVGPGVPPFQPQRPMGPFPSPSMSNRSPAMQPAHLANGPQMPHAPYGGYQQHLQPQQNQPMYGVPQSYDQPYAAYYSPYIQQQMQYPGQPQSPRPYNHGLHAPPQAFVPGQYNNPPQPHTMSRTSSQGHERPPSTLGQPQTPNIPPAHVAQTPSQSSSSPAPSNNSFQLPARSKSKAISIKNAAGESVDLKALTSTSPGPSKMQNQTQTQAQAQAQTQAPVVVSSSTPTPPPRNASTTPGHTRTDSQSVQSAAEVKNTFQEQVRKQLEAEADAKKKKEDEAKKVVQEKEDAEKKAAEAEKAAKAAEDSKQKEAAEKAKVEAEKAEKAKEDAKAKEDEAEKKRLEDEEFERMIAEMEAKEREEEERAKAYEEKKKREREEKEKKEKEAAAKGDDEMKRLEREAEEAEERKMRGETTGESAEAKSERENLFATLKKNTMFGPAASAPTASPTAESGRSTPVSEAAMPPPTSLPSKIPPMNSNKPKPAALKLETNKPVEPAQPTAGMQSLKSARFLQIQSEAINYPQGIKSPNPALNQGGKSRGRQYDKDFLLQFQEVFKEKPSVDWDTKVKETVGDSSDSARPQSARTPSMAGRSSSGRPGLPMGMPSGMMGSFGAGGRTLPPGTTSNERYLASSHGRPPTMGANPFAQGFPGRPGGFPVGGPPLMARTGSSQSLAQAGNSPRNDSRRGNKSSRRGPDKDETQKAKAMPLTAGQDLKPLQATRSGWKAMSLGQAVTAQALPNGHLPPDAVQRKVKAALNKMTPEKFLKISDQILEIAAQSKDEMDGRTMRQVIQLTFEKACDEAHWASMYASFCKRMLETMSPEIKDNNVRDKHGNPVVGGHLFRKYLLNRCQEEFEKGWEVNLPEPGEEKGGSGETQMMSDEYYKAVAAKRKGLGLIQFIGELFKLQMLTGRIMHECVMKLLNFEGLPDESAIESLTRLLKTVGAQMDELHHQQVDMYFDRISKVMNMEGLPSRLHYMLLDIVDLRRAGWKSKDDAKGPKTIQEIREEVRQQQIQAEAERARSQRGPGGRPPLGRGDTRTFSSMMPPPDYPRNQVGMDDLKRLTRGASRNVSSQGPATFGPASNFGSRSGSGRKGLGPTRGDDSGTSTRTGTPPVKDKESSTAHVNAYSALAGLDASGEGADDVASPPSTASSPPVSKTNPVDAVLRSKSPAGGPKP